MVWKTHGKCACDDVSSSGFTMRLPVKETTKPFGCCGESLHVAHDRDQDYCTVHGIVALQPEFPGAKPTVSLVATSYSHGVLVLSSNRTFAWGYNTWRQIGQEDERIYTQVPIEIVPLAGANIEFLAREGHNLAVGLDKSVYSWGRNDKGQLGRTDKSIVGTVTLGLPGKELTGLPRVYAGSFHSAAIVNDNLYTWGWGLYGQLGHGNTDDLLEPKMVSALNGVGRIHDGGIRYEDVASVACGAWHTLVISVTGDVYAFGWNKYGQVKPQKQTTASAVYSPVLVFEDELLCNAEAVQVAAGYRHSAVRFDGLPKPICIFGSIYRQDAGFENTLPRFIGSSSSNVSSSSIYCGRWCTHYLDAPTPKSKLNT